MPLAEKAQKMDHAQLEAHLEEHHVTTFGWALACCQWDRTEAEEVLQTTYLKVLDGSARFDERANFKTWLFAVIKRTAAERRRRAWVRRLAWAGWLARRPEPPSHASAPDVASEAKAQRLVRALAELPARQRQVLHLVFYGELTLAEAARVLGISLGSTRTHYERGKRRLRADLAAGDGR